MTYLLDAYLPGALREINPLADTKAMDENEVVTETGWFARWRPFMAGLALIAVVFAAPFVYFAFQPTPKQKFCSLGLPIVATDTGAEYSITNDPRVVQPAHTNDKCAWVDGNGHRIDMQKLGYA